MRPGVFLGAAVAIYIVGAASHLLTAPIIIAHAGPWPFAALQAALIWLWIILHRNRLRDAGLGTGIATAAGLLYALSVVLLVIVEASFAGAIAGQTDAKAASGLELILLVSIIALLLSSTNYDLTWAVVAILLAVEFIPIALALGTTVWAASQPSLETQPP